MVAAARPPICLQPAEADAAHAVVRPLLEHEASALPSREDVLPQVAPVDLPPDAVRELDRLLVAHRREAMEVRVRITEDRRPQRLEPLQEPLLDVRFLRVDVDREVEEVGHEDRRRVAGADS